MKNKRKYYAKHCLYGINTSYDSFNRQAYSFFAFDSKKERDAWVDNHAYDPYGKLVAAPTKLKMKIIKLYRQDFSPETVKEKLQSLLKCTDWDFIETTSAFGNTRRISRVQLALLLKKNCRIHNTVY